MALTHEQQMRIVKSTLARIERGDPPLVGPNKRKLVSKAKIDLNQAARIAQEFVGVDRAPQNCDALPQFGIYRSEPDTFPVNLYFYFAVSDRIPIRVGGDAYIAVSKTTGKVHSFGVIGDQQPLAALSLMRDRGHGTTMIDRFRPTPDSRSLNRSAAKRTLAPAEIAGPFW